MSLLDEAKSVVRNKVVGDVPMEPFWSRVRYALWYVFAPYSYHADWLKRAGR